MKSLKATLLAAVLAVNAMSSAQATSLLLKEQRLRYHEALTLLKAGKDARFKAIEAQDRGYLLYPYLQYHYLRARLSVVPERSVQAFLKAQAGQPVAAELRRRYLTLLAKQHAWPQFLANYRTGDATTGLRCVHWAQLWKEPRLRPAVGRRAQRFWAAGVPLPQSCQVFFGSWLTQQPHHQALVWARIREAMRLGDTRVARHLRPWLRPADRVWLSRWLAMYQHPAHGLTHVDFPVQTAVARDIVRSGVVRLAYRDPGQAMRDWRALQARYVFFGEDNNFVLRHVGVLAAEDHLPEALTLLGDAVPRRTGDLRVREWRIRSALWNGDWRRAQTFLHQLPVAMQKQHKWRYWQARVDAHLGHPRAARALYQGLAQHRGYYGFLAADRLKLPYSMQASELSVTQNRLADLMRRVPIQVAHELFMVGETAEARREWNFATGRMSHAELGMAAVLASHWGWYDRAIAAINAAGGMNVLSLRFPVAYRELVEQSARFDGIDPGWIYGIMRQESAFMVDAQSPVGALGLMQLMPATGERTARLLQMHLLGTSSILQVSNNVRLGARYLKKVLDDNDGDEVLATASYNAGPDKVQTWRPVHHARSADIWVDNIPYDETRGYVKNVLAFTTVYDYLLGDGARMRTLMRAVTPLGR
ncbi:MAG TPA: transglycosylase SLT domain-containing protein [Acidiferrobacteraceae bacterium]|nr:transglycosylase SLT domain-containing protein [Acidiferrobacteraceae bacterium]